MASCYGANYLVEKDTPWIKDGMWTLGIRGPQRVVAVDAVSKDGGETLWGSMVYQDEGPIGFRAGWLLQGYYDVENQLGVGDAPWHEGSTAPWEEGGNWTMGNREKSRLTSLHIKSNDKGFNFRGTMTYDDEDPVEIRLYKL